MSSSAQGPAAAVPVAPPTPQEINRKLSLHNKPAKTKSAPSTVSGTESDSDSFLSPDQPPHGPGTTYFSTPHHAHTLATSSSATKPLSAIVERRSGSDGEETEDDDDEEADGEEEWRRDAGKSFEANQSIRRPSRDGECTIKSGYLWKKGERRKTWKKRWFVLRPVHLAFYKSSAEYELLRLLDLNEVHSCAPVALKRHPHSLVLVSPARTYYLQAPSEKEMHDWVARLNEARETLRTTSTQTSVTTAPIAIPVPPGSRQAHPQAHSPSTHIMIGTSPPSGNLVTSESESDDGQGDESAGYSPTAPTTMLASPSKAQIDPSKVIVQGYLMKCSRSKRRGWRKRWFVLTGEKLTYSASHMEMKRQRSIMLPQILDALEYDLEKPPGAGGSGHHSMLSPVGSSSASPQPVHVLNSGISARAQSSTSPGFEEHNRQMHVQDSSTGSGGAAGSVPMDHGAPQMSTSSSQSGGQHTFKVVTTKRSLLLCAPSEDEEIKWLSAVRAVIARRAGPAGTSGATAAPISNNPDHGAVDAGPGGVGPRVSVSGMSRRRSASGASGIGPL